MSSTLVSPIESEGMTASIRRFFHSEEVPFGLAMVRIVFPWSLFCAHLARWPFTRELYSLDGSTAPIWNAYNRPGMLPEFSGEIAVVLHTMLILFLVTASIGWCTRISLIGAAVLFTYFNGLDCVSTVAKYSCIGTHVLTILAMSPCGAIWSVDSWLKGSGKKSQLLNPGEPSRSFPRYSMWTTRLLQLSLAFVYLGAGVTKLKTPGFIGGDQLITWMLTHVNYEHLLGDFMAMNPILLIISGYVTIIWEVSFPFVCWRGWGRFFALAVGLGFHLMTLVMLGLTIFPAVVCPIYFAFLYEKDFQRIAWWTRRLYRQYFAWVRDVRLPSLPGFAARCARWALIPSPAVFVLVTSLVSAGGVAAEYALDPYGIRRPEGRYELQPMDPARVAELLTPATPVQDKDVIFSMDVGSTVAGGVIINQRTKFQVGETVTAQCLAAQPHADLYIECNLHDDEDRVVLRNPVIITRESTRGTFTYKLPKTFDPGDYYLVLKKAGTEITRRKIVLNANQETRPPLAN